MWSLHELYKVFTSECRLNKKGNKNFKFTNLKRLKLRLVHCNDHSLGIRMHITRTSSSWFGDSTRIFQFFTKNKKTKFIIFYLGRKKSPLGVAGHLNLRRPNPDWHRGWSHHSLCFLLGWLRGWSAAHKDNFSFSFAKKKETKDFVGKKKKIRAILPQK